MSNRDPSYDEIIEMILNNPNTRMRYLLGCFPPRVPFLVSFDMDPGDFTYQARRHLLRFLNLGRKPYRLMKHHYCIEWSSVAGPIALRDLLLQVTAMHLGRPLLKSSILVMELPVYCSSIAMWLPSMQSNPTNNMAPVYFPGADIRP